jgi:hypothetical protein
MKHIKTINELNKDDFYIKRTSTPYTRDGKADRLSRLVPFKEGEYEQGWVLDSMTPVDSKTGKPKGSSIPISQFTRQYEVSFDQINIAITAALGELANVSWIDRIKAKNKKYLFLYLGKFGLEFKGNIFSPIFKLPVKQEDEEGNRTFDFGKTGNSFWLAAEEVKNKEGDREVMAHSIYLLPDDVSDEELKKISLQGVHSSFHKRFMYAKQQDWERKKAAMARGEEVTHDTMTKREPLSAEKHDLLFDVIKHPSAKTFFIIFKYGVSEKDIVRSAKKAITGEFEKEDSVVFRGKPTGELIKRSRTHGKWFKLDRGVSFWYYNTDSMNKNMKQDWVRLEILKSEKPSGPAQIGRKIEVKNLETNKNFYLMLNPGDEIKMLNPETNSIVKAKVLKTEFKTTNLYRVAIDY